MELLTVLIILYLFTVLLSNPVMLTPINSQLNKCACWQVYDFEEEEWSVLTEKPGHVFGTPMCFLQVPLPHQMSYLKTWLVGQALHPGRCAK